MNIVHLRRTPGTRRLLLIFTGWSTDAALFEPLQMPEGWDVTVAYGFNHTSCTLPELEQYDTVYLLAWSLGVAAAAALLPDAHITAAFAVNGTEHPADDSLGIPRAIFEGTKSNLSPRNLAKFRRRMAGSADAFASLSSHLPEHDDIEALQSQLDFAASCSPSSRLPWRKVFISSDDAIFPPENMRRAWEQHPAQPALIPLQGAHLPDFGRIISLIIPDSLTLADSFRHALPTYDQHATAQRHIAERLASLVAACPHPAHPRVLEIGSGSGLFTRIYAEALRPASATLIDLNAPQCTDIAPQCTAIAADAEEVLASDTLPRDFDLILSASTMQWFVNPHAFIHHAAAHLCPEGSLVCSSFLPGNLAELDDLRPSPVVYYSEETVRQWLAESFMHVETYSENLTMTFDTARDALMHLRHTGVAPAAARRNGAALLRALGSPCTLTYRPLYFRASVPRH